MTQLLRQVFVVDDQRPARTVLSELVRNIPKPKIEVHEFGSAQEALDAANASMPNLILTDYSMPKIDGIEFTERFRTLRGNADVPVVMITNCDQRDIRIKALSSGVTEFLTKPVDPLECRVRCQSLLKQNYQALIIQDRAKWLEQKVIEAVSDIKNHQRETLQRLAKCGEYRDEETGNHVLRMSRYSRLIAEVLGLGERCELIEMAAPLHDIGKIGVSDGILRKPGKHNEAESREMRMHTRYGFELLRDSSNPYLQLGSIIALNHHEKFNGDGYPNQLKGEEIPLEARIVAVADVFDALSSVRPYKKAWSMEDSFGYLVAERGKHFDPQLVDAFMSRRSDVEKIRKELKDLEMPRIAL